MIQECEIPSAKPIFVDFASCSYEESESMNGKKLLKEKLGLLLTLLVVVAVGAAVSFDFYLD